MSRRERWPFAQAGAPSARLVGPLRALVALCLAPGLSLAQPSSDDRALAEALFQEARRLMDAGRFQEACPKLEESQRVAPAGGTLLNLAACHEAIGRLAAAWTEYRDAEAIAKKAGRADREKVARARAAALGPRVPKLVIEVPASVAALGVSVTRDGILVGSAAWGVEVPIDPGPHVVRATASGRVPWEARVELVASKTERVVVPALDSEPPPAPPPPKVQEPPPPPPAPVAVVAPAPPPPQRATRANTRRIVGWSLVGVGAASVGVGTYYGVRALTKKSDAAAGCDGRLCTPDAFHRNEEARSAARASNVFLGLGLVLGGGGLAVVLTAPGRAGEVSLGLTRGGVDVRGRFLACAARPPSQRWRSSACSPPVR